MKFMANQLRQGRAAATIMPYLRGENLIKSGKRLDTPNAPCPCGSGRKRKKCCEAPAFLG